MLPKNLEVAPLENSLEISFILLPYPISDGDINVSLRKHYGRYHVG